jgi:glycerophosphoryl diester phosphodiesterase
MRHESLRQPPIGFAHRGARAHSPENTIEAFTTAVEMGASGVEADVWLTADGVVVVDHDGRIRRSRLVRPRTPIASLDRDQLPPHIPTLAEMLAVVPGHVEVSLDLKDMAALPGVLADARQADAEARLWLCHPRWEVLAEWRDATVARLVDSTRLDAMKEGPERRAANLEAAGIDAVNLPVGDWTGGLTTLFHRFDRYCLAWDAQHERQLVDAVRMGIDGVFSDHVDRMMQAINGVSSPPAD